MGAFTVYSAQVKKTVSAPVCRVGARCVSKVHQVNRQVVGSRAALAALPTARSIRKGPGAAPPAPSRSSPSEIASMADEWPTVAAEYRIIEQIGQVGAARSLGCMEEGLTRAYSNRGAGSVRQGVEGVLRIQAGVCGHQDHGPREDHDQLRGHPGELFARAAAGLEDSAACSLDDGGGNRPRCRP